MSDNESGDAGYQRPRFSRGAIMMIALWGCWAITLSGCFTLAAATSPYQRHLDYIQVGENRDKILQEVGQPDSSTLEEGKRADIFESDPKGPEPGKRMTEVGKGLGADLIVSVCTAGIYPVFIEWGVLPSFVREHHQLGLHLHVDRSNRHACFLPAPRKVTFRIEQSRAVCSPSRAVATKRVRCSPKSTAGSPRTRVAPLRKLSRASPCD